MITQEELEALSRKVSKLYKVDAFKKQWFGYPYYESEYLWLHDDWQVLMDLAVENGIDVFQSKPYKLALARFLNNRQVMQEHYADHADAKQATRVVIMRALIAGEGE